MESGAVRTPGSRVTVNVVYNADSVAELVTADGKSEYNTGESVTFQAYLKKDGSRVTDSSVLGEYKAVLHLSNLTDGTTQDIDMTPDADGMFVYEFRTNQESSYSAYATLEFGSLVHQSGRRGGELRQHTADGGGRRYVGGGKGCGDAGVRPPPQL